MDPQATSLHLEEPQWLGSGLGARGSGLGARGSGLGARGSGLRAWGSGHRAVCSRHTIEAARENRRDGLIVRRIDRTVPDFYYSAWVS